MTAEKHHEEPAMEQPLPEEPKTHDTKPASGAKKSATMRNFVMGTLLGVLVLVVGLLVAFSAGIYKFGWKGPVTTSLVHALPYPMATVNSNPILYADYLDDVTTLKHFYAAQEAEVTAQGGTMPTDEEVNANVFDRLVRNEVLKEEAVKYNVSVTDEDVEAEFAKLVAEAGGEAVVIADIEKLYGWTTAEFKEKVLRPYLLEQKLSAAIAADASLNAESEAKANEVLAKVQGGGDFGALATEYSADFASAQNGGSLGWFERGLMVPEFEEAAFTLAKGETSALVKTQFGYHIIRVDDVETDAKTDERTRVSASHILIPSANVADYLQKRLDEAKVKKLIEI